MHESQLRAGNADDIAWLHDIVTVDPIIPNGGPISTFQIPNHPLSFGKEYFCVMSARLLFFDDNLVGGRTANRNGSPGDQSKYVRPFSPVSNYQISQHNKFKNEEKWS